MYKDISDGIGWCRYAFQIEMNLATGISVSTYIIPHMMAWNTLAVYME